MSNEPNKIIPYTDKQLEEDLKKCVSETKTISNYTDFIERLSKIYDEKCIINLKEK